VLTVWDDETVGIVRKGAVWRLRSISGLQGDELVARAVRKRRDETTEVREGGRERAESWICAQGLAAVAVLRIMGRHSCCHKQKLKKGLWSPEEDEKLVRYITKHGHGCWSAVPKQAGACTTRLILHCSCFLTVCLFG